MLTCSELQELFRYEPDTGRLFWRVSRGRVAAGAEAGCVSFDGYNHYRKLRVSGHNSVGVHIIAWALMTGEIPATLIDHKNGNGLDNRWNNLRLANHSQNRANARLSKTSTTGVKGVTWDARRNKWRARIKVNGVRRSVGEFNSIDDAAAAYAFAAKDSFGAFARVS